MMYVAIDPGLRACGVAVFADASLSRAAHVRSPETVARGPRAWLHMAFAVRTYLGPLFIGASGQHEAFAALEVPQVYQGSKQLGDPDDLLQLAGVVGAIASLGFRGSVDGVAPREWKGTIKPDIVIARVQAILTPEETARVELPTAKGLQHNVWDAVGIGLYTVGRYPPKRIFPA